MVALPGAAGVAVNRFFWGAPSTTGVVVIGVAHAGGGQLGQHRLPAGARLRRQPSTQARHPVGLLIAEHQPAHARPVVVGVGAVGIEAVHQAPGQLGELVGPELGGLNGQVFFGVHTGLEVDGLGQLVEKPPDHRHMICPDRPVPLRRRGRRQDRR